MIKEIPDEMLHSYTQIEQTRPDGKTVSIWRGLARQNSALKVDVGDAQLIDVNVQRLIRCSALTTVNTGTLTRLRDRCGTKGKLCCSIR